MALLLIDVQRGFSDPTWGPRNQPGFEAAVARTLELWRERGWPVAHVHHRSKEPASPLRPGQAGTEPMACAPSRDGEPVFEKSVHSAFIGTGLESWLRSRGIESLALAGLTSDHCVSTTARMGCDLGFGITLIEEACATFDRVTPDGRVIQAQLVHEVSLASLSGEFAEVTTLSRIAELVPAS
jgi:nicotinamidase-related amidase